MNDNPQPDLPSLDEDLVAYLDGELDDQAARRLVDRLNNDAAARQRLRALATSWDLLDHLPRAAVDDAFTRTTVQMISLAASEDIAKEKAVLPARKRRRWIAGAICALSAAMVGFVAVVVAWPDPNEPLLRDLPVVRNLDLYANAKSVDLLRRLDAEGVFVGEPTDSAVSAAAEEPQPTGDEPLSREQLSARRAEIEALPAQEKDDLRKQFDRFQGLSAEQKERYRALDAALRADSEEARLRSVLEQYHNWLPTLSPLERADLLEMSTDDAIAKIRQLKQQETRSLTAEFAKVPLTQSDVEAIEKWVQDRTWKRKDEILKKADDVQQKWFEELPPDRQRRSLVLLAMKIEGGPPRFSEINQTEWNELKKTLSTAAKAALVKIESPDDQKRELFKWHGAALRARDAVSGGVSRDELMRFFREELSDEVRKHLAFLPPEDFQRQLRWEYFKKKEMPPGRWREPWDHRGHGSGRDGGRRRVIILKQPGADSHSNGDRHGGPPPNHERRSSRDRDRDRPPQRSEENPGN